MDFQSITATLVAIITAGITYKGLADQTYRDHHVFDIDGILIHKEYRRLISSGFLHANWWHYAFNILALLSFATVIESELSVPSFIALYFVSLIAGNLLALYIHRNHGDYRALGASGAVSGIIASAILLDPTGKISLLFIPIEFTSWIFGLIFIGISLIGIGKQADLIGHEAHLGGLLAGLIGTAFLSPSTASEHLVYLIILVIPIIGFLCLILWRPDLLITGNWNLNKGSKKNRRISKKKAISLDDILDKIAKKGMQSLTDRERQRLEEYRKKM